MNIPAVRTGRRANRLLLLVLAGLTLGLALSSTSGAAVTHKYLGQITLSEGTNPEPAGVDSAGNLIVFLDDQEVVAKFDTNGNPVNFSALGTNVIDGAGGLECPKVPSDCDRVPSGRLGPFQPTGGQAETGRRNIVQVDSSGGPANGYIYVRNHDFETKTGEIAVFAASGEFLGTVNEAQASPAQSISVPAHNISLAPNGVLYVSRSLLEPLGGPGQGHVDAYAPIDGDPSHTLFLGQLRFAYQYSVKEVNLSPRGLIGAGANGIFVRAGTQRIGELGSWHWYEPAALQQVSQYTTAQNYLPFPASNPTDKLANEPEYLFGAANPVTGNVHLMSGNPNHGMPIYDQEGRQKVGPTIATGGEMVSGARQIAFDNSNGVNKGRFYVKGGTDKISIFSGPVTIPDIQVNAPDIGHKTATLNFEVSPAGGPEVTGCEIEYGLTKTYGSGSLPCDPAPPYTEDTDAAVELTNLFTEADYHYRIKATNANGTNLTTDNSFHTVAVLKTTTEPATNLSSTGATLNGSLDPDGMPTSYKFEYGISTKYDLETPVGNAGSGTGVVQVAPVEVDELQPGKTYHYRLVAENSLGTTYGADASFTVPARPLISGLHPSEVAETSARVHGQIDNFDSPTTYYFEYGTSALYGQSSPVQELGAAAGAQDVSEHLSGLEPGLTYHFRLVATNGYGTSKSPDATFSHTPPTCPNSHARQQSNSSYLPDCRAYELVSPGRAGGVQLYPGDLLKQIGSSPFTSPEIVPRYTYEGLASSPPRFGYFGSLGGIEGLSSTNAILDQYIATRTATGWETTYAATPGHRTAASARGQCNTSLSICIDYELDLFTGKARPFPSVWASDGRSLGRWPTNLNTVPNADHLTGAETFSGDFSHYVFSSLDLPFAPGGLEEAPGSVYDNDVGRGTVEVASRLTNGEDIPAGAGDASEFLEIPAVSDDGSRILMSSRGSAGTDVLYMRVAGAVTYEVSGGVGVNLIGMSRDGSKVAFISDATLNGDDTDSSTDVYVWSEEGDQIALVSTGNGKGNSDACNANWTSNCSIRPLAPDRPDIDDVMSADGDVYFYSPEQLDGSNPGVRNQRNLYHVHEGQVQYVTTLDPGTEVERSQISADGEFAAFLTTAQLTGYNSNYIDPFGAERVAKQMYRFVAATGEVQCVSCNPTGAPPSVLRSDPPANETGAVSADVMASKNGPFMSDDGRVAFATADPLVPRDTNGIIDVYEFVEGRAQLITAGSGSREILPKLALFYPGLNIGLEAISRDGFDLYFSTYDTLVPQDENGNFIKFYDARTNGGFPLPGELLPCTAADECHGETSRPAPDPEIGTGTAYTVPGNAARRKEKSAKKRQKARRRKAKKQLEKRRASGAHQQRGWGNGNG